MSTTAERARSTAEAPPGGTIPADNAGRNNVDATEPAATGGQPPVGVEEDPDPRDAELAEARRAAQ